MGLIRHTREIGLMALKMAAGQYPGFVFGLPLGRDQLPVFTLHEADPDILDPLFTHLAENDYRTLSSDEALAALESGRVPPRSVRLTFDDGYASNWAVLPPLLEKYDLRATVFVVTDRMTEFPGCRLRLDQVSRDGAAQREVLLRDRGPERFMRWDEAAALVATGRVDLQSHTHDHALELAGPELTGFVTPELLEHCRVWTFEWPWLERDGMRLPLEPNALGTPLYRTAPRMTAAPRLIPSAAARNACITRVAEGGGAEFFTRPGWRRELEALHRQGLQRDGQHLADAAETRRRMRTDLTRSRELLQSRIGGCAGDHLAWPWGEGSPDGVALAREAGYRSIYWVEVDRRRVPRAGCDPRRIPRLTWDFIPTLPGHGRRTLARILMDKLRRRARVGLVYQTH